MRLVGQMTLEMVERMTKQNAAKAFQQLMLNNGAQVEDRYLIGYDPRDLFMDPEDERII